MTLGSSSNNFSAAATARLGAAVRLAMETVVRLGAAARLGGACSVPICVIDTRTFLRMLYGGCLVALAIDLLDEAMRAQFQSKST